MGDEHEILKIAGKQLQEFKRNTFWTAFGGIVSLVALVIALIALLK